jgi:uncharacterized membrane protein YdbT with pleckstrin-like domain
MEQESLFEEGEVVLAEARKHFMVYLLDVVLHSLGCVIFIVAAWELSTFGGMFGSYVAYVFVFFVLIFWISFFYAWTKNYFDVWYITNKHVIAVDQEDILKRDEAFMELNRIQDIFFERDGILETWLGYGKLRVQSAGTEQEFVLSGVRDVEGVAHTIMKLRDEAHEGKSREGAGLS